MALATRLLLLVALAVAPALVIVGLNQLELRRSREAEIRLAAERNVNDATSEIRNLVEGVQRLSAVVAKLPDVVTAAAGSGFAEPCSRLLVAIRQDSPGRLDFGIANRNGLVVCTTGGVTTPRSVEGDHLRRAVESNSFVVGNYAELPGLNRRYLTFAHPVRDQSGSAIGAVLTGLDLHWLSEQLAQRLRVPHAVLSVHDRNLTYLLRLPDEAGLVGKPPPPSVQALSRFVNQGAIEAQGADGVRRIGAINSLRFNPDAPPSGDISVAFGLSADAAFQDVNAATYRGLALLAMSMLLAALAAMYGGRRFIGRPVGELLAAARRWRAGDYSARVGVAERSSELGHLATAYEEMADALAAREEERTRAEADLRASEERLRLSQEAGGIGLWDWNPTTQKIVWSDSLRRLWGIPLEAEPSFGLFLAHVHPEDRKNAEEHTRAVLRGEHPFDIELRTPEGPNGVRWIAAKGELISDPTTGRPLRMIGTCQDVTERRRAEEQQRLLINELNHRVKNTLATVQAIAFQSLRSAGREGPGERFEQRLLALSKTHDVLTRENWAGTSMEAVVAETIEPYRGEGSDRFTVTGEEVRIPPNVVVPLSMALHELCTNAAKYGALSRPGGHVDIEWRIVDEDRGRRLLIDWRESGGPPVSEPPVRGFGTRLIERSLARQLAGEVQLHFDCDGVRCTIDIPLGPEASSGTATAALTSPAIHP